MIKVSAEARRMIVAEASLISFRQAAVSVEKFSSGGHEAVTAAWATARSCTTSLQQIKCRKWNWIGHTLQKVPDHIPRQALKWNPQGKRRRGRPKQTWRRRMTAEVKAVRMSEVKREAQDRSEWRRTMDALYPILGTQE
ncbi:uncharacterized protein [Battus philenor]|uniref:uncharacterized protein n=1 Tax=Battus philenor TaxID=42288 RepID=UPI0035CF15F0